MINNSLQEYIDYFRRIAVKHKRILHDPASELQDQPKGLKRFITFSHDEVITGLRSKIDNGIVLFLSLYDFSGEDNNADYYKSTHQASFILAGVAKSTDFAAQESVYVLTEEIVWNIISLLITESKLENNCFAPFHRLKLSDFRAKPVGPLWDGRYGWYVEFTFRHKRNKEILLTQSELDIIWNP